MSEPTEYTTEQRNRDFRLRVALGTKFNGPLPLQGARVLWQYANHLMPIDRAMMSEEQYNALRMMSTTTARLLSVDELVEAVRKHVHVHSLDAQPVGLSRLNRLYGRVAHRLNTTAREVSLDLIAEGKCILFEHGGKHALVSKAVWDALPEIVIGTNEDEYEAMLQKWADKTVK